MSRFFFLLLTLLFLVSCSSQKRIWRDGEIDPKLASSVQETNLELIKIFRHKDLAGLKEICHDSLWSNEKGSLRHLMWGSFSEFSDSNFAIINQFFSKIPEDELGGVSEFSSGEEGALTPRDYTLRFRAMTPEVYAIVGRFLNIEREFALVTFYAKTGGDWKLSSLQFGPVTVDSKDSWAWHESSKEKFARGHYLDASFDCDKAIQTLRPGNAAWTYGGEEEIVNWQKEVLQKANEAYPMPLQVDYVSTGPSILQIYPQRLDAGISPVIILLTELDDPASIAEECDQVHRGIAELFPGIDTDRPFLTYSVYQEAPTRNGDQAFETFYKYFSED